MTTIWGIHNDHPSLDLVTNGVVSIGWDELGDPRDVGNDREAVKARLAATYPNAKLGALPVWAGLILRFVYEMKPGDLVIYPHKPDSTLNFGRVTGDFVWEPAAEIHHNRRSVEWIRTSVPRTEFSKSARYEIGCALTLFKVKRAAAEFEDYLGRGRTAEPAPLPQMDPLDDPDADRIEEFTRDWIVDTLMRSVEGVRFEHLVANLLEALGYRTKVTEASGDGGVDIIAHRDPLGLEPPIIKVQCKRTTTSIGAPDVQKLIGTLASGGSELGLFVTLGSYSKEAVHHGRTRQDLRLINGREFVSLLFEHYEQLAGEWKRLLPMRRVYVVAPQADGS